MSVAAQQQAAAFARRLAGYISSPTKIRSYCIRDYGLTYAPSLGTIEKMRAKVESAQASRRNVPDAEPDDIHDFRPAGLVPATKPKKGPVDPEPADPAPEPVAARLPAQKRKRVYARLSPTDAGPTARGIIHAVADALEVCPHVMIGKSRARDVVTARAVVMVLLREEQLVEGVPRFSYPQIGSVFSGRDHSTVIHACQVRFPEDYAASAIVREVYHSLSKTGASAPA